MQKSEAAAYLAGVKQVEGAQASAPTNLHVITGEVGQKSEDGKTTVSVDGLVFSEEDSQEIEMDTLGGLEEGDIATIILTGEAGHAMTPLAIGAVGSVDRIDAKVIETQLLLADKADIQDLTAATARIDDLEADHVTVNDFTAATGRIGDLEADHVTVNDFTAATGRISDLEADHIGAADIEAEQARVSTLLAGKANVSDLNAATGRIDDLEADHVSVDNFEAATGRIGDLEADHIGTSDLQAEQARVDNLLANKASVSDLNAATGRIGDLEADHVTVADFQAEQANIDTLQANTADIATIRANSAKVQNLTAAQLEADHATIGSLSTTYATIANLNAANGRITNLESTKANISDLDANYITADVIEATYMHANMSNSDVAWIENGAIKNGAIVSAMINDVSANKLTAGTINGSVINVTNLNADNITTGTINGQRIGTGSLSLDKLADDVYTEAEVNNIVDGLNNRIDGAIETHTGTAVPTLNNSPASSWNTTKLKDEHVGDVYYVVNSQSQQNGYCYRFTKSGSTYSWQLIKDSDVTAALSRLTTAEGKITTFDSDISTLKTDTGTLTTRTTNLETRMSDAESDILDKVDTTTFNEVSDTVDAHSQTISQHTTALSNKADNSTVTAVTNRVSTVEQDVDGIETSIGELQTTVSNKADSSTVTTVSNRLNTVSDTVDGHTQTLTSVQNTLSTKADSSTVSTLSTQVNTIEDTVDGHTSQLSSITSTQTTMQSTLDKTVKSSIQLWYSKANTTAPSKPTSKVTSTSTSGNAWRIVVPAYNASYPHYYYCWQYEYVDGTYGWSAVVRDIAMGESQSTARTADSNASAAVTTANTASTNASTALTTANTANTNASEAKTAATTASTTASEAKTTAETAASDASTAKTNAASAVSTANSANTTATNAQSTANANIKSSVQLWFTKANSTAPNKPTSVISTSNANTANAWNLVVPVWNSSYPHYFYCYQQQKGDGTYQWTDVVYDRATSEAQQLANTTSTNLSTLQTDYATFKQTTEQFESTVGTTYATKTELNDATDDITALEGRVSTNETSISNNASAIALKANSSDVYTKSGVDGLISTEVTNRNAAITAKANEITSSVSQTYATKTELGEAVDNRVDVDGEFIYRATGGGQDVPNGRATVQSVRGNTLVWNQLVQNGNFENISNWGVGNCSISASDNELTMVGGETSETPYIQQTITATANSNHHKLLYAADVYLQESGNAALWSNQNIVRVENATSSTWVHVAGITSNNQQDTRFRVYVDYGGSNSNKVTKIKNVMVFDLTLMFGAGNEPATVAEFKAMYPKPYYPYGHGSLLPVRMEGVETVGFNQWDGTYSYTGRYLNANGATSTDVDFDISDYIPVIGGKTYYVNGLTGSNPGLCWYDANKKYIGGLRNFDLLRNTPPRTFTVPSGAAYVCSTVPKANAGTFCINLSDPSRNGTYEPHWSQERAIPVSTYFLTGMRSAGSVYDELTEDAAIQRVGEVQVTSGANYVATRRDGTHTNVQIAISNFDGASNGGLTSDQFEGVANSANVAWLDLPLGKAKMVSIGLWLGLPSTITTVTEANAWLATNKPTFYYELATPTTTPIDPALNLMYRAESGGTERIMVDETLTAPQSAPVPMLVQYGINIYEMDAEDALRTASIESRVTTAESSISQNAQNIELKVSKDGVISTINQSAETVKIQASRVEIDGTATFNAIKSSTDAAYDAKGSAATVQSNLDNLQVGGRNLLQDSKFTTAFGAGWWVLEGLSATLSDNKLVIDGSVAATGKKRIYQPTAKFSHVKNTTYTFSCDIVATAACQVSFGRRYGTVNDYGVTFDVTTTSQRISGTYTSTSTVGAFCISGVSNSATVTISNLKLEIGNTATDWSPAPEDIVSSTQRIYYRWNSSTAPAAPTTWVTKNDDGSALWTKMHVAITSTHKYIYTCEQYKMADGTLGHTDVLLDNTITVIDGGNIITGSVYATALNASSINASKTLTVGAMTDAAAATILNSNVQVGGRNLLPVSQFIKVSGGPDTITSDGYVTDSTPSSDGRSWSYAKSNWHVYLEAGTYTISWDTIVVSTSTGQDLEVFGETSRNWQVAPGRTAFTEIGKKSITFTVSESGNHGVIMKVYDGKVRFKLEKGNKATDWTPAPEDSLEEEQYIYISSASGTTSINKNTTWVTQSNDVQNVWTTKRPTYNSSYPVLFVAKQSKNVGGSVSCTIPVKDDTTTVIDGGHITTGTIDTNRLNAATIKSNIVQTTNLSATQITSGDISADRIKANVISAINSLTAGTINAARINASQLTIGQSQVTNLTSDLAAKADSADIPTNVSDLTNDSGFQTSSQVESAITGKGYQTSSQVESAITSKGYATTSQAQGYANTAKDEAISAAATDATTKANAVQDNLNATRAWYAECPTAAGNAAKVATITPATTDFALAEGVTVAVKFTYANGVASPTLNVNNTGGKSIKRYGTTAPSTSAASSWNAGNVVTLVYDGTYWQMTNWLNNNDNYYDRENYKVALAASTEIAAGRVAAMGSDNKLKILAANSAFDISGPILYVGTAYSAANVTDGATRATNYTFWGTPFALTNTHAITGAAAGKPVYIVGTLSGNMFTPNSDVFTCTTPTSTDNLVYMRLGIMSTTANAVLESQHPLYMYFNGAFQQCDKSTADAAKTATNYIVADSSGIKIADANPSSATTYLQLASTFLDFIRGGVSMLKAWVDGSVAKVRVGAESGFNTLTDGEGIKLRSGTTVLGQFATNLIELGKNSLDSVISLCGGKAKIEYDGRTMFSMTGTSGAEAMHYMLIGSDGTQSEDAFSAISAEGHDATNRAVISVNATYDDSQTSVAGIYAERLNLSYWGGASIATDVYFPMSSFVNAIPVTLYDNDSASASAATTLSETAANFKRLTIFFKDTDSNYSSVDVWSPNGKRVALSLTWINGASTQEMYQRVRWVTISGTSISTYKASGDSKYRTGQIKLGATASVTNSDYIAITHVIGYR